MRESELDREAKEWNLPISRSKTKRPLNVPLTDRMMQLIGPPVEDYIFKASSKSGHTTASGAFQSLSRHCESLGMEAVGTHTLRRTFITNMARLGVPIEIRNRLTNHKDPSIDALYNQHDYLQERRTALCKWDRKLTSILEHAEAASTNVIHIDRVS